MVLSPGSFGLDVCIVELAGEHGYLPLAAGYLASYALADAEVASSARIRLVLDHAQVGIDRVVGRVVDHGHAPDVLALSCQGWSIRQNDAIAAAVRSRNAECLIVYGGNHVSHQGEAFFADHPDADVLVNGEGEETFREVLRCYVEDPTGPHLEGVPGVSFRSTDGSIVSNPDRPRLRDLDDIPSPYLTGLLDEHLADRATVMLETNRGCPYQCSFCYWGQATGQRLHRFGTERLKEEMRFLAERGVDSWYICDANFGILPQDTELVDEIVRLRSTYGFPRTVHTNWAKNSNKRIVELCARLNAGQVHSTYTLALQSTTPHALELANRSNMKINRIDELAALCRLHAVVPRGELIWGLPGETYADFLRSYDDLSRYTDALSVYPLYILPNTEYSERADELGIATLQVEPDTDYHYCVEHAQMSHEDFLTGLRFIVSNNILKVGSAFFRLYPRAARAVLGVRDSDIISGLGDWVLTTDHPMARRFKRYYEDPLTLHRQSLTEVWLAIRRHTTQLLDMFESYIEERMHEGVEPAKRALLRDVLRFEIATYPLMDSAELEKTVEGGGYWDLARFDHDVLAMRRGEVDAPPVEEVEYRIWRPAGLWRYPVSNWYFGLVGYEGQAERVGPAGGSHVSAEGPVLHGAER